MKLNKEQRKTMNRRLYTIDKSEVSNNELDSSVDNPFDSRPINPDNEKKLSQWYREISICQSYQEKYDFDK
ncbi:MAG: hypothetical protein KQH59_01940 [Desulfobulbaceae bacterium]|nr:hypothetical protein [Desulfobulbaceae bacterium]